MNERDTLDPKTLGNPLLAGARRRRVELRDAIADLETVCASPSRKEGWPAEILQRLETVLDALRNHVDEVEADGGLLDEIQENQPRLTAAIVRIRRDHVELFVGVDKAVKVARSVAADPRPETVARLRSLVADVLSLVTVHRQRGSDLVYEAYSVDIGGW